MLNYIWGIMIIAGVAYGAVTGNMAGVSDGALDSSKEAINLCITMLGVMSLWTGLMEVARKAGVIAQLTKLINPFVKYLFPNIPENHSSRQYITTNFIANILGLGWAATPAGLKAMEELRKLNDERCKNVEYTKAGFVKGGSREYANKGVRCLKANIASNEMCTFLIINISSIQLIPVNIIAYRSQYGSVNPTAIVGPGIVATLCSTVAAIIFCKIMSKKTR